MAPSSDASARKAHPRPAEIPADAPSHGFNDAIAWHTLEDGLRVAASSGQPLLLVVHASWCGKCKALKPTFHDPELVTLSKRFVMVNADQDEIPATQTYAPDGTYVPRVLFISPVTGEVDETLANPGRRRYRFFYTPGDDLENMMRKALDRYGSS